MGTVKNLLLIGGGGIAAWGIWKLLKLKKAGDEIITELINPRIHKIDPNPLGGGIVFRTGVRIQNPTRTPVKVSQPTVYLTSDGVRLANSAPSKEVTNIPPEGEVMLSKDIELKLTWGAMMPYIKDLASFIADIVKAWKGNDTQGVKKLFTTPLEMVYKTYVNDNIPYTSEPTQLI